MSDFTADELVLLCGLLERWGNELALSAREAVETGVLHPELVADIEAEVGRVRELRERLG